MQSTLHKAASRRNGIALPRASLPHSTRADARVLPELPSSLAAQMLAQRFALSPSIARLVAEQAGFSSEVITNG